MKASILFANISSVQRTPLWRFGWISDGVLRIINVLNYSMGCMRALDECPSILGRIKPIKVRDRIRNNITAFYERGTFLTNIKSMHISCGPIYNTAVGHTQVRGLMISTWDIRTRRRRRTFMFASSIYSDANSSCWSLGYASVIL